MMGKIGLSATKYIIRAKIDATGVVEKPDVIGAIFGQTEGLLGDELELRELQKSGRIGRIEVTVESQNGKSTGKIEIPTSLNKEDTALIAAALETIDRIGPCNATIIIEALEDVRSSKRDFVLSRAKTLLGKMGETVPESQELSDTLKGNVRTAGLTNYGPDKLPGGPNLELSKDIILVEGRADVLNLLRHGIMNSLGVGGTKVLPSIKDICKGKRVTVFLDGDRGGDLILKTLQQFITISHVARAPTGLEVEELTQKDIIKALRNKTLLRGSAPAPARQTRRPPAANRGHRRTIPVKGHREDLPPQRQHSLPRIQHAGPAQRVPYRPEFKSLGKLMNNIIGSSKACLLKQSGNNFREVGKVPKSDLNDVIQNLQTGKAQAILVDWDIDQGLINDACSKGIKYIAGRRKPHMVKRTPGVFVLDKNDLTQPAPSAAKPKPATRSPPKPAPAGTKPAHPKPAAIVPKPRPVANAAQPIPSAPTPTQTPSSGAQP